MTSTTATATATATEFQIEGATAEAIRAEYQRIEKDAARAASRAYKADGEDASMRVYDAGLTAQRKFALRVRKTLFFRLPESEIASPDERGWYFPLANGWRRQVEFCNAEDTIYTPFLSVAIAERANGAEFPSFGDDE